MMDHTKIGDVSNYVNYHLGDDIKNIRTAKDVLLKLEAAVSELQNRISGSPVSDNSSELSRLLYNADKQVKRSKLLLNEKDQMIKDAADHLTTTEIEVKELTPSVQEITDLEKHLKYLQWIQLINRLGGEMKVGLESAESKRKVVNLFVTLTDLCTGIQSSNCKNLLKYVTDMTSFWYKILKDRLGSEMDELLKQMKWPFITPVPGVTPSPTYDVLCQFESIFALLMDIQLPCQLVTCDVASESSSSSLLLSLPIQFLLKPLRKRFYYHFTGNKKTNNIEKPEWYLTNVLNWIRDHEQFIETYVQPILNRAGCSHTVAKVQFMSGLVELVVIKMTSDMPKVLCEDSILAHTINEVLIFEKELRIRGFPLGQPSCAQVLMKDACFSRWLNIERKLAQDNLDNILSSESAWTVEYQDQSDNLSNKVPPCAEKFITMIMGITERYKILPLPGHRLKFLELQLELIDDFRIRLVQLLEHKEALSSPFCAILNVIYYVTCVLKDWGETPFFLQMQYYRQQFMVMQRSIMERSHTSNGRSQSPLMKMSPEDIMHTSISSINKEALNSIREIENDDLNMYELEETVFEDSVELFGHMKEEMVSKVSESVLLEVKAKSYSYRHEKWFSLPLLKNIELSVSPSACGLLVVLSTSLELLQRELAAQLFTTIWQRIAQKLSDFIYEEVILMSRFSDGGAMQLSFDMNRNLFPLFAEYTKKPENHFRKIKEACILLNLSKGSALLLKEILSNTSKDQLTPGPIADPNIALEEINVHRLKRESALAILKLRIDLDSY